MKKTTGFLLALLIIVSFAFIKPNKESKKITVVIDAAHGGKDHGTTLDQLPEKAIVSQITEKIKAQNSNRDVVIHFTRTSDIFMTFEERTKIINDIKPNLVVSLHVNCNPDENASGMEIFTSTENVAHEKSIDFAKKLNTKLLVNNKFKSNGIKNGKFAILKKSEAPSVLIELGYLTNANDREYLTDENQQERIAASILEFISEIK